MGSIGEELERLAKLRDAGDLTAQEFETLKNRLVDSAADEALPPPDQGSMTRRTEIPSVGAAGQVDELVCSDCDSVVSESATVCPSCGASFDGADQIHDAPSQQPHESDYLYRRLPESQGSGEFVKIGQSYTRYRLLNSRAANFLRRFLGGGNARYRRQHDAQAKRQSTRPKPSAKGKRPIRAWVWVLAALGAIVPIAVPGASLSDVIAGGAAMFFIGWLIDRAIK
jgi:hypothetical protein